MAEQGAPWGIIAVVGGIAAAGAIVYYSLSQPADEYVDPAAAARAEDERVRRFHEDRQRRLAEDAERRARLEAEDRARRQKQQEAYQEDLQRGDPTKAKPEVVVAMGQQMTQEMANAARAAAMAGDDLAARRLLNESKDMREAFAVGPGAVRVQIQRTFFNLALPKPVVGPQGAMINLQYLTKWMPATAKAYVTNPGVILAMVKRNPGGNWPDMNALQAWWDAEQARLRAAGYGPGVEGWTKISGTLPLPAEEDPVAPPHVSAGFHFGTAGDQPPAKPPTLGTVW